MRASILGWIGKTSGTRATDREQRVEAVSKDGGVIDIAGSMQRQAP
jgi:Na+-translocating ferredoxin:NAD+ oxidoreductase RnfG subunit